jgi:branched-chain amino acid transport system permease protein
MLGAFVTYFLATRYGISPALGMFIAALLMGALSALVYYGFLARILKQDQHNQLLATLGLSILIVNTAAILWTPDARALHVPEILPTLHLGRVTIPGNNLFVALVGVCLYLALLYVLNYSRWGTLMRLASDDPELATYSGLDVNKAFALAFIIGGFSAGIAGGLVSLVLYVQPLVGIDLGIRAFAIIALGGLGSVPGAMIGAVVLSIVEGIVNAFVPGGGSWGYGIAFVVLIAVFLVRPYGLFGKELRS